MLPLPLQELGWVRRWEQNPEVQQPNPSLSKFIHLWRRATLFPAHLSAFCLCTCLYKCLPCTCLSRSCWLFFFTCQNTALSAKPFLPWSFSWYPSQMQFLPPLNPIVASAFFRTSSPGFYPSLLSWNVHSEMVSLNYLWVPPPVQFLKPSGHLINIIQIEIDFLYGWYF